jgi:uncharacterized repeat protein (TIGR01451 family)
VSLPPGGPAYFTWTFSMSGCGNSLVLTATVSGTDLLNIVTVFSATGYTIGVPPLALSVTSWHTPASPGPGAAVAYGIMVTNNSETTATNLLVTDSLPPGLTSIAPSSATWFASGVVGNVAWWNATGVTVSPGASFTFTATGFVPATCGTVSFSNTVWAIGTDSCGGTAQQAARWDVFSLLGLAQPTITVAVSHVPSAPQPGMPFLYEILVTNTGTTTLTSLTVVDTLPSLLGVPGPWDPPPTFGVIPAATPSATILMWVSNSVSMPPGTSITFSTTAYVPAACTGTSTSNLAWAKGGVACAGPGLPLSVEAVSSVDTFMVPGQVDGSIAIEAQQEVPGRYFLTVTLTITDTGNSWLNRILPSPDLLITPSNGETVKVSGPSPTGYVDSLMPASLWTTLSPYPCGYSFRWNYRSTTVTPVTITAVATGEVCPAATNPALSCVAQGGSLCTFSASTVTWFSDSGNPGDYTLNRNLFRGRTETLTVTFTLPETTHVTVFVYNSVGQRVRTLYNPSGNTARRMEQNVVWDGTNDQKERCASGVYFVRLETPHWVKTKKVALVK